MTADYTLIQKHTQNIYKKGIIIMGKKKKEKTCCEIIEGIISLVIYLPNWPTALTKQKLLNDCMSSHLNMQRREEGAFLSSRNA